MSQFQSDSSSNTELAESIIPYVYDSTPILTLKQNGEQLIKNSNFQEAYEVYSQALPLIYQNQRPEQIEQTTEEVLLGMAKCAMSLNKFNESKQLCYEVLNSNPNQPTALCYLALIYHQEGNQLKTEKFIKLAYSVNQETDNENYSENQQILQLYKQYSECNNFSENAEGSQTEQNYKNFDILTQIVASTIIGSVSTTTLNWKSRLNIQNGFICLWNSTCIFGYLHWKNKKIKYICCGAYIITLLIILLKTKQFF